MRQHLFWLAISASACTTTSEKDTWTLPVPEPAPEPAADTEMDTGIEDSAIDTGEIDTGEEDTSIDTGEESDTSEDTSEDTGGDTSEDTGEEPQDPVMVSDFNLPDINTVSTSFEQPISPRDYIQQATGWYFIKAT